MFGFFVNKKWSGYILHLDRETSEYTYGDWYNYHYCEPTPAGMNGGVGVTKNGQRIEYMFYPTVGEENSLPGEIWGLSAFHNGDEARLNAAKQFIRYFADGEGTVSAVRAAGSYPVRNTAEGNDLTNIWSNNTVMSGYSVMLNALGEDESVAPNWPVARSEWYKLLQRLAQDDAVLEDEVAAFMEAVK